ncbi:acyltransferase family protein [Parasalinivibrio latis]|uniref:acyltransferase n=1 Tax=Parasalinivibrio latis TaxID=2952610 RepID=UPI0030E50576
MSGQRISSFEAGRVWALIAVITIHSQVFTQQPLIDGKPWIGLLLNQVSRFAVPLFFLLAGYFIAGKIQKARLNHELGALLYGYSKPLLKVWFVWSLVYLSIPFNMETVFTSGYFAERSGYWNYLMMNPLNSLLEGGFVHLWFIPALVIGVVITASIPNTKALIVTTIALYLFGVAAGSYAKLTGLEFYFFTRNGPFFSSLMVCLGYLFAVTGWRPRSSIGWALLLFGLSLHLTEAVSLQKTGTPFNVHDFLLGTPFWAVGIFVLLNNHRDLGNNRVVDALRPYVLGIYLCHIIVTIILFNVIGAFQIPRWIADILLVPVILSLSYAWIKGIEKTPLRSWFLR